MESTTPHTGRPGASPLYILRKLLNIRTRCNARVFLDRELLDRYVLPVVHSCKWMADRPSVHWCHFQKGSRVPMMLVFVGSTGSDFFLVASDDVLLI